MEPPQGKVSYLVDHDKASSDTIDPITMLRKTIEEIEKGELAADQMVIIAINAQKGFHVSYRASRMKASEIVAAVEIIKRSMLKLMGYS